MKQVRPRASGSKPGARSAGCCGQVPQFGAQRLDRQGRDPATAQDRPAPRQFVGRRRLRVNRGRALS